LRKNNDRIKHKNQKRRKATTRS